ncbi:MAG: response regulator [Ignavibacteriales bacterium]|nr:response regulator [Ignavibacteriales bacterium]
MSNENKLDLQALKERIGKHLRTADEFTRYQRYEEAILEIDSALKIDPKNNFARSFLERVKLMQKRSQQNAAVQSGPAELTLEERMEIISRHLSTAEDFVNKKDYKAALEEIAEVYKIDPKNYYAQTFSERIDTLMQEGSVDGAKLFKPVLQAEESDRVRPQEDERGSIIMYRELLKNVWLDGKVSDEEAQELTAVRELFGITQEDHEKLERHVKIEAYLEALHIAWRNNLLTEAEKKTLHMMREKYDISPEEQKISEARYDEVKRPSKSHGTILIVDTDRKILVSLGKALKQRGYTILMAQKVEDAYQILSAQTPHIIMSELFFTNSQIDGVAFFEKLREHSVLKDVPFVIMSSLTDRKIIQAGLRLGVDHYITKPVDIDLLLAIIDGKLRTSL